MLVVAIPDRFRDALPALGADVSAAWYHDAADVEVAVSAAEVLWIGFWKRAEIEHALAVGPRLRWLTTISAGVDSYPLAAIRERGLELTNGAGLHAIPIAEYLVMAVLAAAKGFPALVRAQERREWLERPPGYAEVLGSRALVLGQGRIGGEVSARLRALGVEVVGVRRSGGDGCLGPDEWRPRLGEFDWVIVTLPLTDATRGVIGEAELAAMKPTAWVFNVSRGAHVDTAALERALAGGEVGGAYLDVTDPEPLPADSPLWGLPNAIITPHSSWATRRTPERAAALFLENLRRYRAGEPLLNVVDLEAGY